MFILYMAKVQYVGTSPLQPYVFFSAATKLEAQNYLECILGCNIKIPFTRTKGHMVQ